MKNLTFLITITLIFPLFSISQNAFIPRWMTGELYDTDLATANQTLVGTSPVNNMGATDFALDGNYYGLSGFDNGLYLIDTTNANTTFIATVTPPGAQFWSGMACDPTDGTMYIACTDGNTSTFYTLNLTNGNTTLIGTNTVDDGVVGIAFTDDGTMYAIYLVRKFYIIDKTDATATLVGNLTTSPTGMQYHGLEFCQDNQTMYMTAYNAFTFDSELWTIDITNATNTLVGSITTWSGSIACPIGFVGGLGADTTEVCEGGVVNFTDMSSSGATSWNWSFEGGTPATSTNQNPTVTYNAAGTYDVELIVSNGTINDTILNVDMISVLTIPGQANTPSGETETCQGESYTYTTNGVMYANSYDWEVDPSTAGSFSGSDTNAIFTAAPSYTGAYTVKVRATNNCGDGAWSSTLACNINLMPTIYQLEGGGGYCEGGSGVELTLDGSESGVDYELYFEGSATGNIVSGTGSTLSFGFQTDQGLYTAIGYTTSCTENMLGQSYISIDYLPEQPEVTNGPETSCASDTATYSTSGAFGATSYGWLLEPTNAGTITTNGGTYADVMWDPAFSGTANISVYGINDCGDGPVSAIFSTEVLAEPEPEVSGPESVCSADAEMYETIENTGSTYTWEVIGGEITAGAGTPQITVNWGVAGTGFVTVTEESMDGCFGVSESLEVTIHDCTSIIESDNDGFSVYPNPVKDKLTIELGIYRKSGVTQIRVVNTMGILIDSYQIEDSDHVSINTTSYMTGIYFLQLLTREQLIATKKFVVNN